MRLLRRHADSGALATSAPTDRTNRSRETRAQDPTMGDAVVGSLVGLSLRVGPRDLGTVEEALELDQHPYLLVDTSHWTNGWKRLIPADAILLVDLAERAVHIDLEPEAIRLAPDFDAFTFDSPVMLELLRLAYPDPAASRSGSAVPQTT